jgi:hypothetical protein
VAEVLVAVDALPGLALPPQATMLNAITVASTRANIFFMVDSPPNKHFTLHEVFTLGVFERKTIVLLFVAVVTLYHFKTEK